MLDIDRSQLLRDISEIIIASRHTVIQIVNNAMVQAYWNIGRLIVEYEQKGESRAEYGV